MNFVLLLFKALTSKFYEENMNLCDEFMSKTLIYLQYIVVLTLTLTLQELNKIRSLNFKLSTIKFRK